MYHLKYLITYLHPWKLPQVGILSLILMACSTPPQTAREPQNVPAAPELYATIAQLDSILFTAFNHQDLETQKRIFGTDLEFYHDEGGLMHYGQVIENTANLFAQDSKLTRSLIPGSFEIYPIKGYGAIQIGKHQFCHLENDINDCGTFQFIHIWREKEGQWQLARVISYDH